MIKSQMFWPETGAVQAIIPILMMVAIPLTFAALFLATTEVEIPRYLYVAKLLIKFAAWYIAAVALAATALRIVFGCVREPLGITFIWYVGGALVAGLTIPTFGIFKQTILATRGFPWDAALAQFDQMLFLGHDPWRVTHRIFGTVSATKFFDLMYSFWMILMYGFPGIVIACFADIALRTRLIGSWIASWVFVGGLGAWAFASAGPCYYTALVGPHASFADLNARLAVLLSQAKAQDILINALDFQPRLLAAFHAGGYAPAGGISAMPSMHLAMATLFVIAAVQIHRILGWIMSVYWVLIWIGSIHLGWHYAADGLVAGGMMIAIWQVAKRSRPTNLFSFVTV
jgi:PAP2 superfamily